MNVLEIVILVLLVIPAVFIAVYHFVLGMVGLFCCRVPQSLGWQLELPLRRNNPLPMVADLLDKNSRSSRLVIHKAAEPKTRFAILIPSHNEELNIGKTLSALQNEIDYPSDLVDIYVVADNCSDSTAEIAKSFGVRVLERNDEVNRGKGFALKYSFPIIFEETKCDGVLIVDADCTLDKHSLHSFDYRLQKNPTVPLQLNYIVDNPDESATSYLLGIANCLENEFFYIPKDKLGLFVLLRGTGMYLPRSVLERFPWEAFSIVEDTDYTLQLLDGNISAGFVGEAKVLSAFPAEQKSLFVQRKRWVGGTILFSVSKSLPLILNGLYKCQPRMIDAGITLILLSRPLIIMQLLLTTFVTFLLVYPFHTACSTAFSIASATCWGIYLFYFLCGVFRLGLNRKRLGMLLRLPFEICSYIFLAVRSVLAGPSASWDRTPRK